MEKIAILIPVFNRLEYTKECLDILKQQESTSFFKNNEIRIIVSDDASTDGTAEFIRTRYPEIIVLQGNGNLWWSGCMNLGINYALQNLGSDFVLFWENDITPDNQYFENLQSIITHWQKGTLVCSKIKIKSQPDKIFAMGGIFNFHTGFKKLVGTGDFDGPEYNKIFEADWFCGQGILIHKSIFEKVGLLDEKIFPQYHGDSDFALRAKKAGFRNLIFPDLVVWNDTDTTGIGHIENKTLRQFGQSLVSIRSNYGLSKDIKFYNRHVTNLLAYRYLILKYVTYIGGYFKWKFLGLFNIKKGN
jgi:GT2 family glycosyltransferase